MSTRSGPGRRKYSTCPCRSGGGPGFHGQRPAGSMKRATVSSSLLISSVISTPDGWKRRTSWAKLARTAATGCPLVVATPRPSARPGRDRRRPAWRRSGPPCCAARRAVSLIDRLPEGRIRPDQPHRQVDLAQFGPGRGAAIDRHLAFDAILRARQSSSSRRSFRPIACRTMRNCSVSRSHGGSSTKPWIARASGCPCPRTRLRGDAAEGDAVASQASPPKPDTLADRDRSGRPACPAASHDSIA